MAVLAGPDAVLPADTKGRPAVFRLGGVWEGSRHPEGGTAPSFTANCLADIFAWASQPTAEKIAQDLSQGHFVLLIYGLRSILHAIIDTILSDPGVRSVEVHDIAELSAA